MGIIDILCQSKQCQSQDNVDEIDLVSPTKTLIQELSDNDWSYLLILQFYMKHNIYFASIYMDV